MLSDEVAGAAKTCPVHPGFEEVFDKVRVKDTGRNLHTTPQAARAAQLTDTSGRDTETAVGDMARQALRESEYHTPTSQSFVALLAKVVVTDLAEVAKPDVPRVPSDFRQYFIHMGHDGTNATTPQESGTNLPGISEALLRTTHHPYRKTDGEVRPVALDGPDRFRSDKL